eukprot:Lithocolla_globosa_v1_NODE_1649_length_2420_cov_19.512474.p2 type:complete len:115 gc:universal NODE_1649_length_2420_cov_19.512474:1931-1587(-)
MISSILKLANVNLVLALIDSLQLVVYSLVLLVSLGFLNRIRNALIVMTSRVPPVVFSKNPNAEIRNPVVFFVLRIVWFVVLWNNAFNPQKVITFWQVNLNNLVLVVLNPKGSFV